MFWKICRIYGNIAIVRCSKRKISLIYRLINETFWFNGAGFHSAQLMYLLCNNNIATYVVCLMYARSVLFDLVKPRVPMLVRVRVNASSQDSPASSYCTRLPRDTFVVYWDMRVISL